jgi:ribA/ribD-fused uncharacterized protein
MTTAYLAGPAVFFPNAVEIGCFLKAEAARHGLIGQFPLDNELSTPGTPEGFAATIKLANQRLMDSSQAIIADMSPFRGPSMDIGTGYEMGYGDRAGLLVVGYTADPRSYSERVRAYDSHCRQLANGSWIDGAGLAIEEFGLTENLMMGSPRSLVFGSFSEACAAVAANRGRSPERFTYFFGDEDHYSQWHQNGTQTQFSLPFPGDLLPAGADPAPWARWAEASTIEFICCEQWMMLCKAVAFNDPEAAKAVMEASHPKAHKAAGRRVRGLDGGDWTAADIAYWDNLSRPAVYRGNHAKFTQNPDWLMTLILTAGTTLVEASPFDGIWGIKLKASDPRAANRKTWNGRNWLGETLTLLRDTLLKERVRSSLYGRWARVA